MYKKLYTFNILGHNYGDMDSFLKIFGLSAHGAAVLQQIKDGRVTPVMIAKHINLSRPAIYAILVKLQEQGLVVEKHTGNTRAWKITEVSQIESLFETAKLELFGAMSERTIKYADTGVEVTIYRGRETISNLMKEIFASHRGEKCIGIQGTNVYPGWKDLLGVEFINELNKKIKTSGMINQPIVSTGHFEEAVDIFGLEWAKSFEGRAARTNEIDAKYFKHKGEIFLFKDCVYLISMSEKLVIEIKHSHIQKVLYALIEYIQDTSKVIDGNERLRQIMEITKG